MGRAKAGRKRKDGARTSSGRLSRAKDQTFDRGSDITRDKASVYGTDGSDAIGRAYVTGLLGPDGLNLRNVARSVFHAYWPMYAVGRETCAIGDKSGAANDDELLDQTILDRKIAREAWLNQTLRTVDRMGIDHRRAFDQLVVNINPDCGPSWLDALIWHKHERTPPPASYTRTLRMALEALEKIGG